MAKAKKAAKAKGKAPEAKASKPERKESAKILAFSAKLPAAFVKNFQGKEFKLGRAGNINDDRWTVNGKEVGGIRAAMNHILEATVGENNGRTADNFFNGALVAERKAAEAEKKPEAEKAKKVAKRAGAHKAAKAARKAGKVKKAA